MTTRLVDYFVICGSTKDLKIDDECFLTQDSKLSEYVFKAQLLDRYPRTNHKDSPLTPDIGMFCLPYGVQLRQSCPLPSYYTFTLTGLTGVQTYGGCLSFFEELEEDVEHLYERLEKIKEMSIKTQKIIPRATEDDVSDHEGMIETSEGDNTPVLDNGEEENIELDKLPKSDVEALKKESYRKSLQLFKKQFKMNTHKKHTAYVSKAIAIISHYPLYGLFKEYLVHLYRQHLTPGKLPIERYICNFVDEIPLPPKGCIELHYELPPNIIKLKRPPPNDLPMLGYDFSTIWQCLSVDQVITCFQTMLTEKSLLLFSSTLSKLNIVCSTLRDLMFPFKWHHVYIPILPLKCLEFLNAPMPFLMGTHTNFLPDDIPDHIVLVDLDNGTIKTQGNVKTPLPERETSKLRHGIHKLHIEKSIQYSCKPITDSAFNMALNPMDLPEDENSFVQFETLVPKIRELFLRFFISLFKRYRHYVKLEKKDITIDNFEPCEIFAAKTFIAESSHDSKAFLKVFLGSQAFTQFLFERTLIGDEDEIKFFDESIAAKLNRSRLKLYKSTTPFLNSKEWAHTSIKVALTPNDAGFKDGKKGFCYNTFPSKLSDEYLIKPRYVKPLVAESSVKLEMASRVYNSWSIVLNVLTNLEDQLKLFQKRNTRKALQSSSREEDFKLVINRSKTNLRATHSRSMSLTDYTYSEYESGLHSSHLTQDSKTQDSSILNLGGAPLLLKESENIPCVHLKSIHDVLSRIDFSLEASCYKCGHMMKKSREIRFGWTDSMQEYRTHCASCAEFVMPFLLINFNIAIEENTTEMERPHIRSVSMPTHLASPLPSFGSPQKDVPTHTERFYFLSPFVLRKEVSNMMKKDIFCDAQLLKHQAYIFWNLIFHLKVLGIPLNFLLPRVDFKDVIVHLAQFIESKLAT